jgi:hypothetical protein
MAALRGDNVTRGIRILIGGIVGLFGFTIILAFIYYVVLPVKPCFYQPDPFGPVAMCRFYKTSFYPDFGTFASSIPGIIGVGAGAFLGAVGGAIRGS